ncbi:unnamed protein product [Cladocopium goreaui]|uniref:Voltage-dependent L-type calcium channel subunit alpha-1S n=1 Tax=Cladocopium goreaui TaxID=2562237 RepID=A0A9P1G9G4_9DINO|nr:unnamed protein product [Cladocopium goreaui]
MAAAIASQVLLGPQSALAGDRDRLSMIIGVRKKFLPRILKSYKELQAAGTVTDEFLDEKKMKKFITALMSYGSIQRMDEAPDKISRKLQADAKEVEQYLVAKDYGKAMETLETYRLGFEAAQPPLSVARRACVYGSWLCFRPPYAPSCVLAATTVEEHQASQAAFPEKAGVLAFVSMAAADAKSMTDEEKFFFDLNGFIHVRGALSAEEVKSLNDGIDAHRGEIKERTDTALRNTRADSPLAGDGKTGRRDLGGMLGWPKPHCLPWRNLLSHPRLLPYLTTLCSPGYRMDHLPLIITSYKGSEGFHLHGGPLTEAGHFNPTLQYRCVNGQFYNSLLAMSVQLVDHAPGDGGFCVIRGSHKLNFPVPPDFLHGAGAEAKDC